MFGGIVEIHHLDTFHLLDRFEKSLCLLIGDVPHHEARRPVGDKFTLHHVQADLGGGSGRQIGRQVVFHVDPVHGHCRKNDPDNHNQENQAALVDNDGRQLQHKVVLFLRFLVHDLSVPRYQISAFLRIGFHSFRLRRYRVMLPLTALEYKYLFCSFSGYYPLYLPVIVSFL